MKRVCLLALVAVAGIWGCVPSMHGIATKDTIVWDEGLIGRWGDPNKVDDPNAEVWQFEKGEKPGLYGFTHRDKGVAGKFNVYLVQLGDKLFLDLYPVDTGGDNMNSMTQLHLLPVHTFMLVDEIGPELRLRFMDPDHVRDLLKEQPDLLKHETTDENGEGIVLTAGSSELQDFLVTYVERIFAEKSESGLKRI